MAMLSSTWASAVASSIKVVEIGEDVEVDVSTFPGHVVTIDVAEPTTLAVLGNKRDYWLEKVNSTHYLLQTKTRSAPQTNVNIDSWGGHAVIRVRAAESADDATLHIRLVHPRNDKTPLAEARDPEHARALHHRMLAHYAMQTTTVLANDVKHWHEGSHDLELHTGYVAQGEEISVFPFTLRNRGHDYPITRFELRDHMGKTIPASFHSPPDSNFDSDSVLGRDKSIKGAFVLEAPVKLDQGWQLRLSTTKGVVAAQFSHDSLPVFEPGMLELRTMVSVHGLGGASQLSAPAGWVSPAPGMDMSTWASVTGAGVQAYYGPSKHTAMVAGFDFIRTAQASIDMAPGILETRATGGRVHLGGRLHTGEKLVPYARAGLGLMFANHTFSMGGERDSEFRVAGLLSMGAGIEAWIRERFVVGLGVNGSVPIGGNETGLIVEGGLRVGVAFGKLRDHWTIRR